MLLFLALAVILELVLRRTVLGRTLYVIGLNETAGRLSGLRVGAVKLAAFTLSGGCAALAGLVMTSRTNSTVANAGFGMEFDSIIAAVLGGTSLFGGRGGALRTVVGVAVLGVLNNLLILLDVPIEAQQIAKGAGVPHRRLGRQRPAAAVRAPDMLRRLNRQTALLVALAITAFFAVEVPGLFLTPGNLANVARQVSLDAPLVFGQTLVLIAGGIDISLGSTMAMAGALVAGLQGYGAPVAVAAALSFGLGVGALNGLLATRFRIVPFVATLGTMSLVRGLLLTYTQQQSIPITDTSLIRLGGDLGPLPVPLLCSLVLLAAAQPRPGPDAHRAGSLRDRRQPRGGLPRRHRGRALALPGVPRQRPPGRARRRPAGRAAELGHRAARQRTRRCSPSRPR